MTGARLELANPHTYSSPREYIEQHLAPAVAELHRITNELLSPGATSAEEWAVDMVPSDGPLAIFSRLDGALQPNLGKHVVFDGTEYFTLPKELLRAKQLKVQLTAVVYAMHPFGEEPGDVHFRLVRDDGAVIDNSHLVTKLSEPSSIHRPLPFGDKPGSVSPEKRTYYIEGCSPNRSSLPVCRRFSLSFVYI